MANKKMYSVRTYSADGQGWSNGRLLGSGLSLSEARAMCRQYLGMRRLSASRRWHPGVGVEQDGTQHYSSEAYNDYPPTHNRANGCGGVAIITSA